MAKTKNANEVFSSQRKQLGLLMNEVYEHKAKNVSELATLQERLDNIDNEIKVALENGNQAEYERLSVSKNYLSDRKKYLTEPRKMVPLADEDVTRAFVKSIFDDARAYESEKMEEIKTLCTSLYNACKEMETIVISANGLLDGWNSNIRDFSLEIGKIEFHTKAVGLLRDLEKGVFRNYVVGGIDDYKKYPFDRR